MAALEEEASGAGWCEDERVVRTLALNAPKDVADLLELVGKILGKIVEYPTEAKFRSLRAASKALSGRVLARPGGRELLGQVGFKTTNDGEAKVELKAVAGEADYLKGAIAWCAAFAASPPLAKATELKVMLPSGTTLRAAFRAGETVRDVNAYVDAYAGGGPFVLGTFRPSAKFDTEASLDATLEAAGLAPRAALAATPKVDPVAAGGDARTATEKAMDDARDRDLRDRALARASRDASDKRAREARLQRKRDDDRARTDALRGFDADREEKTEQVERDRRASQSRARRQAEAEAQARETAEASRPRRADRLSPEEEPEPGDDGAEARARPRPTPSATTDEIAE